VVESLEDRAIFRKERLSSRINGRMKSLIREVQKE
jgi:hypothetical protein